MDLFYKILEAGFDIGVLGLCWILMFGVASIVLCSPIIALAILGEWLDEKVK
jgi:hypothetical protein